MAEDYTSSIARDSISSSKTESAPSLTLSIDHSSMAAEQRDSPSACAAPQTRLQGNEISKIQYEPFDCITQIYQGRSSQFSTGGEKNDRYDHESDVDEIVYQYYTGNERRSSRNRFRERVDRNSRRRSRSPEHHAYSDSTPGRVRCMAPGNQEGFQNVFARDCIADLIPYQKNRSRSGLEVSAPTPYISELPQQHPGSRKHQRWCPIYIHTAKCDRCLHHNVDILQRCVDGCSMQFCRFCLQSIIGKDNKHVAPTGGFDWASKSKGAVKRHRSQTSDAANASAKRGRVLRADPFLAPFFHSSNRVVSINSARATVMSSESVRSANGSINARVGGAWESARKPSNRARYEGDSDQVSSVANEHFTNDVRACDANNDGSIILEDNSSEICTQNDEFHRSSRETYETLHPTPHRPYPSSATEFAFNANLSQEQHIPRLSVEESHPLSLDEICRFSDAVTILCAMRSRPRISDQEEQEFQEMRMAAWSEDATLQKIKEDESVEEAEKIFQAVTLVMRLRLGFYGVG